MRIEALRRREKQRGSNQWKKEGARYGRRERGKDFVFYEEKNWIRTFKLLVIIDYHQNYPKCESLEMIYYQLIRCNELNFGKKFRQRKCQTFR